MRICSIQTLAVLLCCTGGCMPLRELSSYSDSPAAIAGAGSDPPAAEVGSARAPGPVDGGLGGALAALDAAPSTPANARRDLDSVTDAGPSSASLACGAPGERAADTGRCYLIDAGAASWSTSSVACADWGGALVRIDSPEEEAFLAGDPLGDAWIGLNDRETEGDLRWDGGGELGAYSHWAAEQPDDFDGSEDCVELLADGRGWNDRPCADLRAYACER
jgi:Lectin C-type domain